MHRLISAIVLVMALGLPTVCPAQNLIQNGDFETGDLSSWTSSGAWDVGAGYLSDYSAVLATETLEMYDLYQDIVTTPGTVYLVSGWFLNEANLDRENRLEIYWNDTLIGFFSGMDSFPWEYHKTNVIGTGNDRLRLTGYNNLGAWQVDDLRLQPSVVPEWPAFLHLATFAAFGGAIARRRLLRK